MRTTRRMFDRRLSAAMIVAVLMLGFAPVFARTITFTEGDADKMAIIAAEVPRLSWAGCDLGGGVYNTAPFRIAPQHSFLIRVPLDKIPKGNRITKAEWSVPIEYIWTSEPRLFVWRLLADWGAGVCYQYRTTRPKPIEWSVAGAQGASTDRAAKPTTVAKPKGPGDTAVINVTQDVEVWYTGAAANNGWIFTVEDDIPVGIQFLSPLTNVGNWKLRITYEPQ